MPILLSELLAAGGRLHGPARAERFADWSYDSRLTAPGDCFVALRTSRADGHDYIPAALAAGAAAILCRWPPPDPGVATLILADDPQALLLGWAAARLAAVAAQTIAVAGSVGKTTTRRAIAAVLGAVATTFQSRRSFNSLLGLPIALGRLEDGCRYALLEFGSDRRGEIATLAARFPPQLGVVTNVGAVHLRSFGDLATVAAEQGDLLAALPADGVALVNADDPRLGAAARRAAAPLLSYGLGPGAELRGLYPRYGLDGTRLRLSHAGAQADCGIPLLGEPAVYAALAAVAVGLACGLDLAACAAALAFVEPPAGRLRPLPARGGAILLDDSYSAAPPSVRAALRALAALPARRRFALLGDPGDLPAADALRYARELGKLAAHSADALILQGDWGVEAARAARTARADLPIALVDTAAAAVAALPHDLGPGDLLLVKGDGRARMERVSALLLDLRPAPPPSLTEAGAPGSAWRFHRTFPPSPLGKERLGSEGRAPSPEKLLVRQEPAWRSVRVGAPDRPTWLRIDLDAVAGNVRALRARAGVPLMAVLKADAYGHGAVRVARAALGAGATALAVATLGEARALRAHEVAAPLLVLGYTPSWQVAELAQLGLDCTLFDDDTAHALSAAAQARGGRARVHLKVDTGMGRLGLPPAEVGPFLRRLSALPGLEVAGIYTHFAGADMPDPAWAEAQLATFLGLLRELAAAGLRPPLAHAANSAAALRLPAARLDMIRPGIACYGLAPSADLPLPPGFRPALSFHSEVAQVKAHPAGTPLSYGGVFVTARPSLIATVPVGYADGLRRAPPWRELLVRGRRAPIVGRICMDYALVDVSDIAGVKRGDAVVLIGAQGDAAISVDEVAAWLGTISYEVLTSILPRVPRELAG